MARSCTVRTPCSEALKVLKWNTAQVSSLLVKSWWRLISNACSEQWDYWRKQVRTSQFQFRMKGRLLFVTDLAINNNHPKEGLENPLISCGQYLIISPESVRCWLLEYWSREGSVEQLFSFNYNFRWIDFSDCHHRRRWSISQQRFFNLTNCCHLMIEWIGDRRVRR